MPGLEGRLMVTDRGCLEFSGYRNQDGYGQLSVGNKLQYAHRYAWSIVNGAIPAGMLVCHTCDNPACCNVSHLFLGSPGDNVHDMWRKRRGVTPTPSTTRASHCRRGHAFEPPNERIRRDGRRTCRACERIREKKRSRVRGSA